jgi:hypothetical protein
MQSKTNDLALVLAKFALRAQTTLSPKLMLFCQPLHYVFEAAHSPRVRRLGIEPLAGGLR